MGCGSGDIWCQFLVWFSENSEYLKDIPKLVDLWGDAFGEKGWAIAFIKEHGEKIIAAASLSFAIWRWWVYRERILHKRLEEYITESDSRLKPTSEQVVAALLRPGRTVSLPQPAYAVELRDILETNGWRTWFGFGGIHAETNWQLGRRLSGIRTRIRTARAALISLQNEQAQLHMIAGAIAASKARRTKNKVHAARWDEKALREFQKVLRTPGQQNNFKAKENEAFQLLKLGQIDLAYRAYVDLEAMVEGLADPTELAIVVARAKRYQAQILHLQAGDGFALNAFRLVVGPAHGPNTGSIALRAPYQPFDGWDAIEQAEIHFLGSVLADRGGYVQIAPAQLTAARTAYNDALSGLPRWFWFMCREHRYLRAVAKRGLERISEYPNNAAEL